MLTSQKAQNVKDWSKLSDKIIPFGLRKYYYLKSGARSRESLLVVPRFSSTNQRETCRSCCSSPLPLHGIAKPAPLRRVRFCFAPFAVVFQGNRESRTTPPSIRYLRAKQAISPVASVADRNRSSHGRSMGDRLASTRPSTTLWSVKI